MATIAITKVSVREVQSKMFAITLNLKVEDGGVAIIDQDFTQNHKIGKTPAYTVGKFRRQMQAAITRYKAEQKISKAAALTTAINKLEGELTWQ